MTFYVPRSWMARFEEHRPGRWTGLSSALLGATFGFEKAARGRRGLFRGLLFRLGSGWFAGGPCRCLRVGEWHNDRACRLKQFGLGFHNWSRLRRTHLITTGQQRSQRFFGLSRSRNALPEENPPA